MDNAQITMLLTFAGSIIVAAITNRLWVSVGLILLILSIAVGSQMRGPGLLEALLFISPFLIAGLFLYGGVALAGATVGLWLRKQLQGFSARKQE
jgi:energy-coupling factor transporter transmembrane protein EcfT